MGAASRSFIQSNRTDTFEVLGIKRFPYPKYVGTIYVSTNEELLPERSMSYDFTISQCLLNYRMLVELNIFYIKGDNIIESVPVTPDFSQNRNVGEFANKGIELSLNYQILNNFSLNCNYSYLHMDTPITGAPRNKFYAGLTYNPGKFTFSLGVQCIDKLY